MQTEPGNDLWSFLALSACIHFEASTSAISLYSGFLCVSANPRGATPHIPEKGARLGFLSVSGGA